MIVLHRLNGSEFILNANHIETIEETPDTVISLTSEKKYIVAEKKDEILKLVVEYYRGVFFNRG